VTFGPAGDRSDCLNLHLDEASSDKEVQAIDALIEVILDLEKEKEVEPLLDRLLFHARRIMDAPAASIFMTQEKHLEFLACQNDEVDVNSLLLNDEAKLRIPISRASIAGYVALTGEEIFISDVSAIPKEKSYSFDSTADKLTGFTTNNLLAIPMRHPEDGVVGTLQLINLKAGKPDKAKLALLKSFVILATVSVVNLRLRGSLQDAYLETVLRLAVASECKDKNTYEHIQRIRHTTKIITEELDIPSQERENIFHASAMHDIGKIGIPDHILNKPGALTPSEREIMDSHPENGAKILHGSSAKILQVSEKVALCHHEKWDGSGYPNKLKGEQIPLAARIVALADVFDALMQSRSYKDMWKLDDALELIRKEKNCHFDPKLVDIFFSRLRDILYIQCEFGELSHAEADKALEYLGL
jgi:HD-GYP domain-containing protein (c-di-GMP phosphodiesterase class II)